MIHHLERDGVVGALAVGENIPAVLSDLPPLDWKELSNTDGVDRRYRTEQPIMDEEDVLFRSEEVNTLGLKSK